MISVNDEGCRWSETVPESGRRSRQPHARTARRGDLPAAFQAALDGKPRAAIKALLMDQSVIAGIGNIYSDEILFQAGLNPAAKTAEIDGRARQSLLATIRDVLSRAIACRAGSEIAVDRLPRTFLLPQRHGRGLCPRCGTAIARIKAAGRHAYFCTRCQGRPSGYNDRRPPWSSRMPDR